MQSPLLASVIRRSSYKSVARFAATWFSGTLRLHQTRSFQVPRTHLYNSRHPFRLEDLFDRRGLSLGKRGGWREGEGGGGEKEKIPFNYRDTRLSHPFSPPNKDPGPGGRTLSRETVTRLKILFTDGERAIIIFYGTFRLPFRRARSPANFIPIGARR